MRHILSFNSSPIPIKRGSIMSLKMRKFYKTIRGALKKLVDLKLKHHHNKCTKKNNLSTHEKCSLSLSNFQQQIHQLKTDKMNQSIGPDFKIYESDYLYIKSTPKKATRILKSDYINNYQTPPPPLPPKNKFLSPPSFVSRKICINKDIY